MKLTKTFPPQWAEIARLEGEGVVLFFNYAKILRWLLAEANNFRNEEMYKGEPPPPPFYPPHRCDLKWALTGDRLHATHLHAISPSANGKVNNAKYLEKLPYRVSIYLFIFLAS